VTARLTSAGCAIESPDGTIQGLQVYSWDDKSGLVITKDGPSLRRGEYVPDRAISASYWPQLVDPNPNWRRNIVPTAVRISSNGGT